jgi:hypothetical protein
MTAPELKPCPFCGGAASAYPDQNHSTGWSVGCFNRVCDVEPYIWAVHKSTAEMQWDKRTHPPEVLELVEAAKAQLQYMDLCNDKGDLERNLRAALAPFAAMGVK